MAWGVLALCVLWAIWRVVVAVLAGVEGPIGRVGDHAASVFSIVQALLLLAVSIGLLIGDPIPPRTRRFLTCAVGFAGTAWILALVLDVVGLVRPPEPIPTPLALVGLIGFLAMQAIPAVIVWALWVLRKRVGAEDLDRIRSALPGDLGISRENLIDDADEPTRRIPRDEFGSGLTSR